MFEVEPTRESGGICDCCGNQTRTIWGYVHENGGGTIACYFVQWTVGKSIADHPANFDLIYGAWADGTPKSERCAISLVYFEAEGVPSFSVVNANDRPIVSSELVGSAMARNELVGTPLAERVFSIVDAIVLQDARLH